MAMSEEEQVKAMLEANNAENLESLDETFAEQVAAEDQSNIDALLNDIQSETAGEEAAAEEPPAEEEPAAEEVAEAAPATEEPAEEAAPAIETPVDSATPKVSPPSKRAPSSGREMNVSTMVRLMGLPTTKQLQVLESRVDMMATKISQIILKIERLNETVSAAFSDSYLDRIDFQLADIRTMVKNIADEAGRPSSSAVNNAAPSPTTPAPSSSEESSAAESESAE